MCQIWGDYPQTKRRTENAGIPFCVPLNVSPKNGHWWFCWLPLVARVYGSELHGGRGSHKTGDACGGGRVPKASEGAPKKPNANSRNPLALNHPLCTYPFQTFDNMGSPSRPRCGDKAQENLPYEQRKMYQSFHLGKTWGRSAFACLFFHKIEEPRKLARTARVAPVAKGPQEIVLQETAKKPYSTTTANVH